MELQPAGPQVTILPGQSGGQAPAADAEKRTREYEYPRVLRDSIRTLSGAQACAP